MQVQHGDGVLLSDIEVSVAVGANVWAKHLGGVIQVALAGGGGGVRGDAATQANWTR